MNAKVVESSAKVFEDAAIESVKKYRYGPRIVGGEPQSVDGVTSRVVFEL